MKSGSESSSKNASPTRYFLSASLGRRTAIEHAKSLSTIITAPALSSSPA